MEVNEALNIVQSQLTKERFAHTERVVEQAQILADQNGVDQKKAAVAAALHDYAKERPLRELRYWITHSTLPKDLLTFHHELWHGPVGAQLISSEHGVTWPDIQSAVYYHTTGKPHMSRLDMIVYVSDFIEPGRAFPGVQDIRDVSRTDLLKAAWMISSHTIQYLLNKQSRIYPETMYTYNDLTLKVQQRKQANSI